MVAWGCYVPAGIDDLPCGWVYHVQVDAVIADVIVVVDLPLLVFGFGRKGKASDSVAKKHLQGVDTHHQPDEQPVA